MPVFDFRCLQCDHIFEFSRAFGNKTKPACPECKAKKTEKLMSPPMVVFKGEGFYKTDSMKKPVMKEEKETKEKNDLPVARQTQRSPSGPDGQGQASNSESEGGKKDETSKSEASQKAKNTDASKT